MIAFYGDSLTSGDNNNGISFVDKLTIQDRIYNYGVSGTTLGEYSLYPVWGNSLVNQLANTKPEIFQTIVLEYGINDVSAICMGNVTESQVIIELRRCVDYIYQCNPYVNLVFLILGDDSVVRDMAARQIAYLRNDYYQSISNYLYNTDCWFSSYKHLCYCASQLCATIPMWLDGQSLSEFIDFDGLHPDDTGYSIIAGNIQKELGKS